MYELRREKMYAKFDSIFFYCNKTKIYYQIKKNKNDK